MRTKKWLFLDSINAVSNNLRNLKGTVESELKRTACRYVSVYIDKGSLCSIYKLNKKGTEAGIHIVSVK